MKANFMDGNNLQCWSNSWVDFNNFLYILFPTISRDCTYNIIFTCTCDATFLFYFAATAAGPQSCTFSQMHNLEKNRLWQTCRIFQISYTADHICNRLQISPSSFDHVKVQVRVKVVSVAGLHMRYLYLRRQHKASFRCYSHYEAKSLHL